MISGLLVIAFQVSQLALPPGGKSVIRIPADGYRNHWTRNILFSKDLRSLSLTIGSVANLDKPKPRRAVIERYPIDSSGKISGPCETYATGMRNQIGLALQPETGKLWANVAERDYEGDDLVPDFLTSVKPHGFYGWLSNQTARS